MPVDASWTDDQLVAHFKALHKEERFEEIRNLEDQDLVYRVLDLLDLTWGEVFGMVNFFEEDAPRQQGPLNYGADTNVGNGLNDGRYVFQVDQNVAYVYREWDDIGDQPLGQFPTDLPDGTIGIAESQQMEWVGHWAVDPAQQAAFYGNREFHERHAELETATDQFVRYCLPALVAESGRRMTFRATSKWLVDGAQFGELFHLLEPVALHGTIEFTRHRTRPNDITVSGLTYRVAPPGYDTNLTGTGDDQALALVEHTLKTFTESDQYPYRDRGRVHIAFHA